MSTNTKVKYNLASAITTAVIVETSFWVLVVGCYWVLKRYYSAFRLENEWGFWLLLLLPFISMLYVTGVMRKNKRLSKLASQENIPTVVRKLGGTGSLIRYIALRLAFGLLVLACIDPKIGTKLTEGTTKGIDIMLCLDVSTSMNAEDLTPTRLVKAKRAIEQLLDQLHGDRIGLVIFAGAAYNMLPITTDYNAAKSFLKSVDSGIIPVQGTAIGDAIDMACESFEAESAGQKVVIVITDGENHEQGAEAAAEEAQAKGIIVHTIGMGSLEGAPIPIYRNGKQAGYKTDQAGKTVVTKLNEPMLRSLVEAGGGIFVRASNADTGLNALLAEMRKLEKSNLATVEFQDYEHRYQYLLLPALLLFFLAMAMPEKRIDLGNLKKR